MAMILKTTSREQPTAAFFPARRSSHRRAGLSSVLLRCADRHSVVVSGDASVAFRGQEGPTLIPAIENSEALELVGGLVFHIAPISASIPDRAQSLATFRIATVEDEDEGDDLDEDDDLLTDDDDEDLDDEDEDEDEEVDEDEDDDLDDLDDEEDEEDEDDE